uniref:Ubiquitinyl hydrolase 1 n=1 Tax=Wuchereria bancrofti TaxID=6293 RepID=A0A1I8EEW4_WUCBA
MHSSIPIKHVLAIKTRYLSDMILCLSDVTLLVADMALESVAQFNIKSHGLISVEKNEMLLTDNLHQGFVELYNDGEASSLRIFYLENGERRLERECTQISDLERAEDCSSLVFRICKLKSGIDCNEHIVTRFITPFVISNKNAQQQLVVQKRTLVKQLSTFQQISVTHQACIARDLIEWNNNENNNKVIPQRMKNWNQKRKLTTSTDIYLHSSNKRFTHKSQKKVRNILLSPLIKQHSDESLKEENRISGINGVITKSNNSKKEITSLDDAFLCTRRRQFASHLSTSFERLSAGTDTVSPKRFLNLGNSCYVNALLQGLFHIEAFNDMLNVVPESSQGTFLSVLRALRKNCRKSPSAKQRCLLGNVFKFLDDERFEMSGQEGAFLHAKFWQKGGKMKKKVREEGHFFGIVQSIMFEFITDAQEFLTIVLDKIDSELESFAISTDTESIISLSSIFGFELKHELTCNKCGIEQVMCEKGLFLPIQIVNEVNSDTPSLQVLLENCLKSELVEHICLQCNEKYATMSHEFLNFSKCLIIFLKRYDFKHSTSRARQRKLKDAVKLSKCIRLISYNRECYEPKNCFSSLFPISNNISGDEVSFVLETPPNYVAPSDSSNSENIREDLKRAVSKAVQEIKDCDGEKLAGKLEQSTKSSVVADDSNVDERLDYLTLFCLPRPDFCERCCAELNIRYRFSAKSVPSKIAPVVADGNCLFRSIALYLSGSDEEHLIVRENVVKFEEKYDDLLREVNHFSLVKWEEHIKKMTNDGEWATEIEILALAALLDVEIWTFFNSRWLRYRPLYTVGKDGKSHKLPIQKYDNSRKNAIFLINENFHYKPVLDIISNGAICDYNLAAVISHKGIGPSKGQCSLYN